ncbi:MAG: YjdF family protein [Deltaproteobacteria bacterium]|nr:YjdF family protein [Deltaproteobacteria bacterium]
MRVRLNVFFDGSFWVGVFERRSGEALSVARVVFGPEPSGAELYRFLLEHYPRSIPYGPPLADEDGLPETPRNPKRAQREARRSAEAGVGRKAWESMRLAREMSKVERATHSRAEREAEAQRKFELKQLKRKQKHRGH